MFPTEVVGNSGWQRGSLLVCFSLILIPSHTQPLPHNTQRPTLSLSSYYKEGLGKRPQTSSGGTLLGKDQGNPTSPTLRAQQRVERKGAEPGARGVCEGSDRTKDGHRAGKRDSSGRDSSCTTIPSQRPLQDPPASCHHGPHSSSLSRSPAPRPGNSSERKEISQRRYFRR